MDFTPFIREAFGSDIATIKATPIGGGDTSESYIIETDKVELFIKLNNRSFYEMYCLEAEGLAILKNEGRQNTPEVFHIGETEDHAFVLMNVIEAERPTDIDWENAGRSIAQLHQCKGQTYGLEKDNFIGKHPQKNIQDNDWVYFFIDNRLEYQRAIARLNNPLPLQLEMAFDNLYGKLPSLLQAESPVLLHGDLWAGNMMFSKGDMILVDPAVYYGIAEMEMAFTTLFGGFASTFYAAYQEITPWATGWKERFDLYNLYPLLVHYNTFGESYLPQIESTLEQYK